MEGYEHVTYHITIQDPTYSAQSTHAYKVNKTHYLHFYRYYMQRGLPYSKWMLEYVTLHKVVPQFFWNNLLLLQKASYNDGPTCDGMHILLT
jgi:hypothetical protein